MNIKLPNQLNHGNTRAVLAKLYKSTFANEVPSAVFDWRDTEKATLAEIISILAWSSQLTIKGKAVTWLFYSPAAIEVSTALQLQAQTILGVTRFDQVSEQLRTLTADVAKGRISLVVYRDRLAGLRFAIDHLTSSTKKTVYNWIDNELGVCLHAGLLTYLYRYEVLQRAVELGIELKPNPNELPRFSSMRSTDTACLELRSIASPTQVTRLVDDLAEPTELVRVLGSYSTLDVARGGAFANILAAELGHNVAEHAEASSAWFCTRVVKDDQLVKMTSGDPCLQPFVKQGSGFLEVIICDNGSGLISKLHPVLASDKRQSVFNKCKNRGIESDQQLTLIDYAFDRLSSSKRSIAKLIHLEKEENGDRYLVASGLYWIWNLLRSHSGVLAVHTANHCAWYDFTEVYPEIRPWSSVPLNNDKVLAPFPGTMLRACLPLDDGEINKTTIIPARQYLNRDLPSPRVSSSPIKILWVGELTRAVSIATLRLTTGSASDQGNLLTLANYGDELILRELQRQHCSLVDGDILVFDLCGLRSAWATHAVASLCHFMLEMNFTSTMGRSAVVLWNVPVSARELFEEGVKIAAEAYSQLDGIRRAALMVFDDGTMQIFCGVPAIERRLEVLREQDDLDLDELGPGVMEAHEKRELVKFIAENGHLFEPAGVNRVRLRAWPYALRAEGWRQSISWLNTKLNQDITENGICRRPRREYFRLPSTGDLVREFYQFRGFLSNEENCAKITWMIFQVLKALAPKVRDSQKINVITVSRSTAPLLNHLADNYFKFSSSPVFTSIAEGSADELSLRSIEIEGPAILVTDVISSGELCGRIVRSLTNVNWLGVVALLDTRDRNSTDSIVNELELDYGIEVLQREPIEKVPVYAFAWRAVEKLTPTRSRTGSSEAIDEVNVSPVEPFQHLPNTDRNLWDYVRAKPEALLIGHSSSPYHHYLYKVHVGNLLEAANPKAQGQTLLTYIVETVATDLKKIQYDPDKTVIVHPPRKTSHAENIARLVQQMTGALYRHVLYKDNFAGHWRFSPFVRHGVPLDGATVILIDDGTNTGETLMGLLDVAAAGNPTNVLAYVGITRMLPHKNSHFHNIKKLEYVEGKVAIRFALGLNIPVYNPKNCPACKQSSDLMRTQELSPLLGRYTTQLIDRMRGMQTEQETSTNSDFLWRYGSAISVTRLREALETLDYHQGAYQYVNRLLQSIVSTRDNGSSSALIDLSFVICAEPEIAAATVFVRYLSLLTEALLIEIESCSEDRLLTLIVCLFHLTVQLKQRLSVSEDQTNAPWTGLFRRERVSIQLLSQCLTLVLSYGLAARRDGPQIQNTLSLQWLQQLQQVVSSVTPAESEQAKAAASIYLREAIPVLRGAKFSASRKFETEDARALYRLADETAHEFWWHSANTMKGYIYSVIDELPKAEQPSIKVLYGSISPLFQAFGDLCELQQELSEIEDLSRRTSGEHPGGDLFWNSAPLSNALIEFIQKLVKVGETIERREAIARHELIEESIALKKKWEELYLLLNPAFSSIFPEVCKVAYMIWQEFSAISELPESVRTPIRIIPPLSDDARGFVPQILLRRFLTVAIQNLKTHAFAAWTSDQITQNGRAQLEISQDEIDGTPAIRIRLIDNGPELERESSQREASSGHGTGLGDVERMAFFYNAHLQRPYPFSDNESAVELTVIQRQNRSEDELEPGGEANGE